MLIRQGAGGRRPPGTRAELKMLTCDITSCQHSTAVRAVMSLDPLVLLVAVDPALLLYFLSVSLPLSRPLLFSILSLGIYWCIIFVTVVWQRAVSEREWASATLDSH